LEHVTCLGCGCACDDIDVRTQGGRILEARRACELGVTWFGDGRVPARVRLQGHDVTTTEALDAAAALLAGAARPLVYLAPEISCEAQRQGVAVADLLRARLDSVTSATASNSVLAAQERGRASATLGEIRNRADVLVFWGVDPALRYPRYGSRYAPEPAGIHVADGRRSRTVVAVDVGDARGPADADVRIAVPPGDEIATLTTLAAMLSPPASWPLGPGPWALGLPLAQTLRTARYAVIVADAEQGTTSDSGRASALIALAQALNGPARGALSTLRAGGNRSGADAVMSSQTGYPVAVDFSRGYPRYRPLDGGAAACLARGEVDAVLILGAPARIPANLLEMLARAPAVAIGPRASESAFAARGCVVDTGIAGIHDAGTAMRMDDVPLPLRQVISGPPAAADIVGALVERLMKTDARGASARRIVAQRPAEATGCASEGTSPDSRMTTQRKASQRSTNG
jgi:formylmethanofuran dehydrogenase subunit B